MKHYLSLCIVNCVLLCIVLSGCGHSQGRSTVSGTVTLDGVPLESGTISFEPVGGQLLKVQSGASIVSGKYTVPRATGLVPGEYSVRIASPKQTDKLIEQTPMGPVYEVLDIVPSDFGAESKQRITVTGTGKQVFNFDMRQR